ncbi:hypothetical protein ABS772_14475 [Methylorubrum podarium]|uniref:Uncharacterized protein n=1 Tax=Methylorubrum podarium TaxID=200476 RepID=A0ABV1QP54_9HYPH
MTLRTAHPVNPYLQLAEFGAALFNGAASAEERITLEIIGDVRMVSPEAIRSADASPGGTEAVPARKASAERSTDRVAARHN